MEAGGLGPQRFVLRNAEREEKELKRAKNAAYRYLTGRPRSRAEVESKLREKEFNDSVIRQVIADLVRLGYVNDRLFAEQWARSRVRLRGFGRRRIEQELRDKRVNQDVIREVFAEVFDDDVEIETARRAAQKKLSTLHAVDHETRRRRLAGFLERKGFSYGTIRTVLKDTDMR